MITLVELLEDAKYRQFFSTVPRTLVPVPGQLPWRLYIQREAGGPWLRKDFEKYADAFRRIAPDLKRGGVHDGAIQSRNIAFAPPERIAKITKGGKPVLVKSSNGSVSQKTQVVIWKPKLPADEESHTWCTYCRRPTVFRWFKSHHALRGYGAQGLVINPADTRCTICAAREEFIRRTAGSARRADYDPRTALAKRRSRR